MSFTLARRRRPFLVGWRRQAFCPRTYGGRCGLVPAAFDDVSHRYWNHAPSATLAVKGGPCRLHKDAAMTASLTRTCSPPWARPPRACPMTWPARWKTPSLRCRAATAPGPSPAGVPAVHPPGRCRRWPPWPGSNRTPGQRLALARIDRANAGLSFLLELLHATERARGRGYRPADGDGAREGCCWLLPWAGRVCGRAVAGGVSIQRREVREALSSVARCAQLQRFRWLIITGAPIVRTFSGVPGCTR